MMSAAKTALVKAKDSVKDGVTEAVRKAKEAQQAREEEREERRAAEEERRAIQEEERRIQEEERRAMEEARAAEQAMLNSQQMEQQQEQFSNFSSAVFNAPPASIGNYANVSAIHNPNFVSSQQFSMPQNNFMPASPNHNSNQYNNNMGGGGGGGGGNMNGGGNFGGGGYGNRPTGPGPMFGGGGMSPPTMRNEQQWQQWQYASWLVDGSVAAGPDAAAATGRRVARPTTAVATLVGAWPTADTLEVDVW
jgi:hypothetical protein